MTDNGIWELIEIEVLPTDGDDGGFGDEGAGSVRAPDRTESGYVLSLEKERFEIKAYHQDKGRWLREEDNLTLKGQHATYRLVDHSGILTQDFTDEEHGRTLRLSFARRTLNTQKLSTKIKKKLDHLYDLVIECDFFDEKAFEKIRSENSEMNDAIMRWAEEKYLLSFALYQKKYRLIENLVAQGYDVNIKEDESPLEIASQIKTKKGREIVDRLKELGAA